MAVIVAGDVDFIERTITVQHSKTQAGERVIPLNADAWASILELRERALALFGEIRPEWFLLPRAEGRGKRKALDALSSGGSMGSYGTDDVTNEPAEPAAHPQVIEKAGGPG